ncbi:MAG: hypothetical protein IJZ77_04765 [Bacilli bacterium]|nr:hypothetical protein [Bacilli bacterium]
MGKNDMFREDDSLAVGVIKMVKKSLVRVYALLILFIILFVFSIIDSIYQRCRIIDLLEEFEVVEETITETTNVEQESGDNSNNNFINGNDNEVHN